MNIGTARLAAIVVSLLSGPVSLAETTLAPNSTVLPGIGSLDRRIVVDPGAAPWRALARLQIPGVGKCTAFLVAPQVALTAAHCVHSERLGRIVPPGSIHLLSGYAFGAFTRHTVATAVRLADGYDPARPDASRGVDAARLDLAAPLAAEADTMTLTESAAAPGERVTLAGYSQERAETMMADRCGVTGAARDGGGHPMFIHNCNGSRGTSGAPLLAMVERRPVVIGLQVAAFDGSAGGVAVPADVLAALLRAR